MQSNKSNALLGVFVVHLAVLSTIYTNFGKAR
jgi:hypothetical protein